MSQEVHLVDKNGQSYGLKIFASEEGYGLVGATEVEVLTSFYHPSIIRASEILNLEQYGIGILLPLGKMTLKTALPILDQSEIIKGMGDLASALAFLHTHNISCPSLKLEDIIIRGEAGSRRFILASLENLKPITEDNDDVYKLGLLYFNILTRENYCPEKKDRLNYLKEKIGKKFPSSLDLLFRMLDPDKENRITSSDVIKSGFFITNNNYVEPESKIHVDNTKDNWVAKYWISKVNGTFEEENKYVQEFLDLEKAMIINRKYQ